MEVFVTEDKVFNGLLFQDALMNFAAYPEVLMVDATYKLNELRMPLYLMIVVDSSGQSEIVGVFITALETEEAISKMVQAFKDQNPAWPATKVVMSDKDFVERAVFQKEFPNASLHICLFHTLRSLKREVTCDKLGLRPGERDHALEILTKLAYSSSAEEYIQHYQALQDSGLRSVINYYDTNWHPICHQWVECFKGANFCVGEKTNNRIESINAKVKSVCSKYASLSTFFDQFFSVLACLRNERNHSILMAIAKKRITTYPPESPEERFTKLLTPYALSYVEKQLALREKVAVVADDGVNCSISSSAGTLTVTTDSCQCTFWTSMNLPCRHMFAVREKRQLPLYSAAGVAQRWTMTYMHDTFTGKKASVADSSCQVCAPSLLQNHTVSQCSAVLQITGVAGERTKAVLSQHQKFHKAQIVAQELSSLASEVGMPEFEERLTVLKSLRDLWAHGEKAVIVETGTSAHTGSEGIGCHGMCEYTHTCMCLHSSQSGVVE